MYRDTSKEAYESNKGNRLTMCVQMLGIYREKGDLTDEEFKCITGWEINQITARRNDLLNKVDCYGKHIPDIEKKGKKKNLKGRNVFMWGLIFRGDLFNG